MKRPDNNGIRDIWEKIVTSCRYEKAVFDQGHFYTYEDLDERSWMVANSIRAITQATRIGILMDNSYDYVCAALGILKAGKCFVPLDVEWPLERLEFVRQNSGLDIVIAANHPKGTMAAVCMEELYDKTPMQTMARSWGEENEAYILYSSGTMGRPKGILIGRDSVANLAQWFGKTFLRHGIKNVLQLAKTTFDVSIEEIFGTLFSGGTLFIPQPIVRRHKRRVRQFIEENEIQLVEVVPATLKEFFDKEDVIPCLKSIICGADVLQEELKNSILQLGYELYNNYGPTETTVDAMYHKCSLEEPVQLGCCIDGGEMIVIGEKGEILLDQGEGELLLAGVNLAIGYVNDVELNESKFVSIEGKRYYKTGDLVTRDADGRILYRGRKDNQIKIRGQRVELEEIERIFADEMRLSLCSAVCKKEHGDKIVAFYEAETDFEYSRLTEAMKRKLPEYMVPTLFLRLEHLPLTENGKVDRRALVEYEVDISESSVTAQKYDETTERLIGLMAEALETQEEAIDLNAVIEQMGFDSLSFVRFLVKVEEVWDIELDDNFLVPNDAQTGAELIEELKEMIIGA